MPLVLKEWQNCYPRFSAKLVKDDFDNPDVIFDVYGRCFTLRQLKQVVVSYQPDSPFTAWNIAKDWEVTEVIELIELLAETNQEVL